jgi:hypothetical protein
MLTTEDFHAKVHRIATALFYKVLVDPEPNKYEHRADLRSEAGDEGLSIRNGGYSYKDRIVIRGYYPPDFKGQYHTSGRDHPPDITAAEAKTAEEIVRDITRRLLPGYLKQLQEVRQRNAEAKASFDLKESALNQLAAAIGTNHRSSHNDSAMLYFTKGAAEVHYDGDVGLKITVPLSVAVHILSILRQSRKKAA